MTTRAGKFSAAFLITQDERAQLAEELMASIDRDDDDDDDGEISRRHAREDIELRHTAGAEEDAPASADRWENGSGQVRLTRST